MQVGVVGAGRMGSNIARRLARAGHECIVQDVDVSALAALDDDAISGVSTLPELVRRLAPPRTLWVMVPSGEATASTLGLLADELSDGDTLIDGGNSHYKHSVERARELAARGIDFIDVGTSGGVHGLTRGYCLMIGGSERAISRHVEIFRALGSGVGELDRTSTLDWSALSTTTAQEGWLHCGPSGAGHYVKMIHNGIEYGMMQAFAEGFQLMKTSELGLDPPAIAEVWRRGSVVTSWLLDLIAEALAETPELENYGSQVADTGEGRWSVQAAIEQSVSAPVLTAALFERFRSRQDDSFADKLLSAMRFKFGGHRTTAGL